MDRQKLLKALKELSFIDKGFTAYEDIIISLFQYLARLDKNSTVEGKEREWVFRVAAEAKFIEVGFSSEMNEEVFSDLRKAVPNILGEEERKIAFGRAVDLEETLVHENIIDDEGFGDPLYIFVINEPFFLVSGGIVVDGICRYKEYDGMDDYYLYNITEALRGQNKDKFEAFMKQRHEENNGNISGKDAMDALESILKENN